MIPAQSTAPSPLETTGKNLSRSSRSRGRDLLLGWILPIAAATILVLRYPSYEAQPGIMKMYFWGVYHPRFLGSELVVGIGHFVDSLHLPIGILQRNPHGELAGLVIVNFCSFVACAAVVYWFSARRDRTLLIPYVVIVVAMAVSGAIVTPYDYLSLAFFAAIFVVATSKVRPNLLVCAVLVVLGTSTRESTFVAIAAVAAQRIRYSPRALSNPVAARLRSTVSDLWALRRDAVVMLTLGVGLATYLIAHRIFEAHHSVQLFQHVVHYWQRKSAIGLSVATAIFFAVRAANWRWHRDRELRFRRRLFWLLTWPYLAICVVYGLWNEAPRLLFPLLLGEFLLTVSRSRQIAAGAPVVETVANYDVVGTPPTN